MSLSGLTEEQIESFCQDWAARSGRVLIPPTPSTISPYTTSTRPLTLLPHAASDRRFATLEDDARQVRTGMTSRAGFADISTSTIREQQQQQQPETTTVTVSLYLQEEPRLPQAIQGGKCIHRGHRKIGKTHTNRCTF